MVRELEMIEKMENDVVILKMIGELDALVAPQLKEKMEKGFEEGKVKYIIDFTEVIHINSLAMGILRGQLKSAKEAGGDVKLSGMNEHIRDIFEMIGLDELFEIYSTEKEALKNYNTI